MKKDIQVTQFYWTKSKEWCLSFLKSHEQGLTDKQSHIRRVKYGTNTLVVKHASLLLRFFLQFLNPLTLLLLFASLMSFLFGSKTDFLLIFSIVIASAVIDFFQNYSAQKAVDKLKKRVSLSASVIRNGVKQELSASHLVPGDIIFLSAGDMVPADGRILTSRNLLVDQSALTGESYPQDKTDIVLNDVHLSVGLQTNCVFMGTHVISGEGTALVYAIGMETAFGNIAQDLGEKEQDTEFQHGIKHFGFFLMKITLVLTILVFFINAALKHDIFESFLFSLALAVGLTPELLPLIVSINLSKGALRMAKKGVIVKDLPAIENLGSMNILCTDKTGTLTEDRIELEYYENMLGKEDDRVLFWGYLNSFHHGGLRSPLEHAILAHKEVNIDGFTSSGEIPFDFVRKRFSFITKHLNTHILITKGAPEGIFPLCNKYQIADECHDFSKDVRNKVLKRFEQLSSQGFRVLAIASKKIDFKKEYRVEDESDLTFIGLLAFLDPPKKSAQEALKDLEQKGITVFVLTGDNELVTNRVCKEIGLAVKGILTGNKLEVLSEEKLAETCTHTTIYARLSPAQKTRIITSLQKQGNVVGFLGDGINDAPSLKAADVGVSVHNAVDVAKESADFILLHKDLHVIKDGVIEGRRTYINVMKYIMMGTSSNFGNMVSLAFTSLILPFIPMLPVQILLTNLLYDSSQLALPSDHVKAEYLDKPRKWNIHFIRRFMVVFGPISTAFDFLTFFFLLYVLKASMELFRTGWFIESLLTQVLIIYSIRTKRVPFFKSKPSTLLIFSTLTVVCFGMIIPLTPIAPIFSFIPPPITFYLFLAILVILYFTVVETVKGWFYTRYDL